MFLAVLLYPYPLVSSQHLLILFLVRAFRAPHSFLMPLLLGSPLFLTSYELSRCFPFFPAPPSVQRPLLQRHPPHGSPCSRSFPLLRSLELPLVPLIGCESIRGCPFVWSSCLHHLLLRRPGSHGFRSFLSPQGLPLVPSMRRVRDRVSPFVLGRPSLVVDGWLLSPTRSRRRPLLLSLHLRKGALPWPRR